MLPDDPRLGALFHEAGELGLPVLIHTADPVAFFDPIDAENERLEELGVHPEWSFHGPGFPAFDELLASLEALVAGASGHDVRHARTSAATPRISRTSTGC